MLEIYFNSLPYIYYLCWTNNMSIHLKQQFHTRYAIVHSKGDSNHIWQRAHMRVLTMTRLLVKFTLVGNLSRKTLHVVVNTCDMIEKTYISCFD